MKTITKLSALFLILNFYNPCLAQFPNGGFEEWVMVENYMEPVGWDTEQDTFLNKIFMDTMSVEGNYSVRMQSESDNEFTDCRSQMDIYTRFDNEESNIKSVSFYLKIEVEDIDEGGFFSFFIWPKIDGNNLSPVIWQTDQVFDEFTFFDFPIDEPGIDSVYIEFAAGPILNSSDECVGYTTAWIDDLRFNKIPTSSEEEEVNSAVLYPNPNRGVVQVAENVEGFDKFTVFDLLGRKISQGDVDDQQFLLDGKGCFFVELLNLKNGKTSRMHRIVVTD